MRVQFTLLTAALLGLPAIMAAQTQDDLFDDSVDHEIRMTMDPAKWQALVTHVLDDTEYAVDKFVWGGPRSLTLTLNNITIHSRGYGSRDARKPGLHVSFDPQNLGQRFLGLSSLELKSNTEDGSLLHERLTFKLATRMGLPTSREVSCRLFVNDVYEGLFNCVEFLKSEFLTRWFNENNGYLYKYTPGWPLPSAGWHFEYAPLGDVLENYAVTPPANKPAPFVPETHSNAPDTVTLHNFFQFINQASDADFLANVTGPNAYVDPKQFLQLIAVETYVADYDCILGDVFGTNNFYLYRFQNKQLSQFLIWDKDLSFDWTVRPILQNAHQNVLMNRLISFPQYMSMYLEDLNKVAAVAGGPGGWLEQEVYRQYNQIKADAYNDPNKLTEYAGNHVSVPNDSSSAGAYVTQGCTALSTVPPFCLTFEAYNNFLKAFPGIRTPFVLQAVSDQGYQLPASYPALGNGGFVSVGTHTTPVAAGAAAELYGANFGSSSNTTVYINGFQAPLLFTSAGQLDVQVPWETGGPVTIAVVVNGSPSNVINASVSQYAPVILAVTHTDGQSYVTSGNPAAANETIVVYATGLGPVTGGMVDGQLALASPLQRTTQTPAVTIGGVGATPSFAGLTPGYLGLYQINVPVPANLPAGAQNQLVVTIGGASSAPTAVATK
jgi:uncharacterized protein (TIGR03437 family)